MQMLASRSSLEAEEAQAELQKPPTAQGGAGAFGTVSEVSSRQRTPSKSAHDCLCTPSVTCSFCFRAQTDHSVDSQDSERLLQ